MIRVLDIFLSFLGLLLSLPLLLLLVVLGLHDTGAPIFLQQRLGRDQRPFTLVKFRTMKVGTPSVGTHLANISSITALGHFLRRTKLDELPQLWNVFMGDMSLVGPRPCLTNQHELIHERERRGIFSVRPGITGLAQIKKIDMSTPALLAETDQHMIQNLTVAKYLGYICSTLTGKGGGDRIR